MSSVTRLGDFLDFGQLYKAFGKINLPKSPTFLGIFCKGVKIYHFSSEINFGQLLLTFGDFLLVTLIMSITHDKQENFDSTYISHEIKVKPTVLCYSLLLKTLLPR